MMSIATLYDTRWKLLLQAQSWRAMMAIGMRLHKMANPRPREPSFRRRIQTTVSPQKGEIELLFYTPTDYDEQRAGSFQRASQIHSLGRTLSLKRRGRSKSLSSAQSQINRDVAINEELGFPVVVNFHGGGFTIGRAGDDARWADAVCRYVNAVVVSVEYRLAPEHPFPTAVEDGVDAILYLVANAIELGIDPTRIAVSGFSAGGNMAFTVPLKLQDVLHNPFGTRYPEQQERDAPSEDALKDPSLPIVAIVAWYPSTDFATNTRPERRLSNIRPEKELPAFFTAMFDASYLHPKSAVSLSSPYLSPGLAPESMLCALPDHVIMYTCEWDELLEEAERMRDRLMNVAGKKVVYRKMEGKAHAFDKSPNPIKWDPAIEAVYEEACVALKEAFDIDGKKTHSSHL